MCAVSEYQLDLMCEIESLCYDADTAYDRDLMREMLEEPGVLLLCEWRAGRLAGFQVNDRSTETIITIDVHPDFRRQGIARSLMRRSLEVLTAVGQRRVFSQVGVTNTASIMLHMRFGFKIRHRIPNYYGPGDDAFLLARSLKKGKRKGSRT